MNSFIFRSLAIAGFFCLLITTVDASETHQSEQHTFKVLTLCKGLEHPWGMAFLPDGNILITERPGRLRLCKQGQLDPTPIHGLPDTIDATGQGGLLDIVLDPQFKKNHILYLSYAGKHKGKSGSEVIKATLNGKQLQNVKRIFTVQPKTKGANHYGSRLLFGADGSLFITTGDRYYFMREAQNPDNHLGTIVRIHTDGSVPADNPFVDHSSYRPEVYSYGHRNVQGIALRAEDNSIWAHEHGPRGGDEVNLIRAGENYGWPDITYGIDYDGSIISSKTHAKGLQQPVIYWDPSIAPSGMSFYYGDQFPHWQGNLFVGALAKMHLRRLQLDGDKIISQEILLQGIGRIRDVRTAPDGFIYLLTDEKNARLLRLQPAD